MQSNDAPRSPRAAPRNSSPSPRILLLGAGHAHLYALKHGGDYDRHGAAATAVSPEEFWYSGLATGMLGGQYEPDADRVDAGALGAARGIRVIRGEAQHIDVERRCVTLLGGTVLDYDLLSLNVGSTVAPLPGSADHPAVFPVKPVRMLWELRRFLSARLAAPSGAAPGGTLRVVVAGGGATGCEIAANVDALARRHGRRIAVTIVTAGSRLLEQLPAGAAREVERLLRRRGIAILCGREVERIERREALLADGAALEFDALVNATGLEPPPLIAASGLAADRHGALLVDARLRCVGDELIFGAGDCIAIDGHPLPRVGVYAVRQAPVLHAN
ncbi:MAG: FAD-dependent oxidoreductase, partial [Gammaproteobacteria bacterium]|nr:FAD-dependent oxidoreductase [Gammaproteobacteria bacterium]